MAFPPQDDYLGVWGQVETLGKAPSHLEDRKRGLPVVLAAQEDPGAVATAELRDLLEALAIRPRAQALVQEAAGEAPRALNDLQMKPPWGQRFKQLAQFVVPRAV